MSPRNRFPMIKGSCVLQVSHMRKLPVYILFTFLGISNVLAQKKDLPNIVLIVADDLGYGDLHTYGNESVKTPNIDRLANEGIRFTDFHANAPMCSPTRAALLTGRYQQRTGVEEVGGVIKESEVLISQRLRDDAGYRTGIFGKWHISGHLMPAAFYAKKNPVRFGFDEFVGFMSGFVDYHSHLDDAGRLDWWHNDSLVHENGSTTQLITEHATDFIKANLTHPFFLYVPYQSIHFPWMTHKDSAYFEPGIKYTTAGDPANSRLGPYDGSDRLQHVVNKMIEELDSGVGKIVRTLEQYKIADNTLVFFVSDNGGYVHFRGLNNGRISRNFPFRGHKTELYEGGHRVPSIAWWPGRIASGIVSDQLVMTHDLFPTFLEVAGLKPAPAESANRLDGVSLSRLLFENKPIPKRKVFWAFEDQRSVRDRNWKLLVTKDKRTELYNLKRNPEETREVAAENRAIVRRLEKALRRWEDDVFQGRNLDTRQRLH